MNTRDPETESGADNVEEFLPEFVHQYLQDHIALADQKAGFIFAAVSAVLAYVASKDDLSLLKTVFSPDASLDAGGWIALLAMVALIVSAVLSIWVIAPRLGARNKAGKGFIFWKDIVSFPDPAAYSAEMARLTPAEASLQIRAHCYAVAKICNQKYERLKWGIWMGTLAFFLTILSFMVSK